MESNLSRKDFLKASMLAGMGVLGAGSLAACAPQGESASGAGAANAEGVAWDQEVDVLVVGSGTGGTMAAAAARAVPKTCHPREERVLGRHVGHVGRRILRADELRGQGAGRRGQPRGCREVHHGLLRRPRRAEARRDVRRQREPVLEWARDTFKWTWGLHLGHDVPGLLQAYEGYRAFGRGSVSMVDEDRTQTPWGEAAGHREGHGHRSADEDGRRAPRDRRRRRRGGRRDGQRQVHPCEDVRRAGHRRFSTTIPTWSSRTCRSPST